MSDDENTKATESTAIVATQDFCREIGTGTQPEVHVRPHKDTATMDAEFLLDGPDGTMLALEFDADSAEEVGRALLDAVDAEEGAATDESTSDTPKENTDNGEEEERPTPPLEVPAAPIIADLAAHPLYLRGFPERARDGDAGLVDGEIELLASGGRLEVLAVAEEDGYSPYERNDARRLACGFKLDPDAVAPLVEQLQAFEKEARDGRTTALEDYGDNVDE